MRLYPSALAGLARPGGVAAKPEEAGSGNPDPTMKPAGKSDPAAIKGENMPPRGGEDIAPADGRSPQTTRESTTQEHAESGETG